MKEALIVIGFYLMTLTLPKSTIDYTYIDSGVIEYVKEFELEMRKNGITIPKQKSWRIYVNPLMSKGQILGYASGMFKDDHVFIMLHPIIPTLYNKDTARFIIWHELAHDLFNVKHGSCYLMKPSASPTDGLRFEYAKDEFILFLKKHL